jgi:hypothetical protein
MDGTHARKRGHGFALGVFMRGEDFIRRISVERFIEQSELYKSR